MDLNPFSLITGASNSLFPNAANGPTMNSLNKIPGAVKPYYKPYIGAGKWALGQLQNQYGNLLNNPQEIISRIGSGYKQSPGYDWRMQQGQAAIGNANAAGGTAGTQQHLQQAGDLAGNLASEDYEKYLQHGLGLYGAGLSGTQAISGQGLSASNELAQAIAQALSGKAQLQYAGQANQNNQTGDILGSIIGLGSRYLSGGLAG